VHSRGKARGLLRLFGFRSAIHRRERFWTTDQLDPAKETARGNEIKLDTLRDLLARYSTDAKPSQASHRNGQEASREFVTRLSNRSGRRSTPVWD